MVLLFCPKLYFPSLERCHHCPEDVMSGLDLLNHLRISDRCREKYTESQNKSLLGLIYLQFSCLFCGLKSGKFLRPHLGKNSFCKMEYCKFYNIAIQGDVIGKIMNKVRNSKRIDFPSRKAENRRQENASEKKKKGVIRFLTETAIGPAVHSCSTCGISGTRRQMVNIDQDQKQCNNCINGIAHPVVPEPFIEPKYTIVDFLGMIAPEAGTNSLDDEEFSTVLLPSSYFPFEEFSFSRVPNSNQKHVRDIYRGIMDFAEVYPLIYETEVKKIIDSKYSPVLPGRISNLQTREINLYSPEIQTQKVPGTDDYYHRGQFDVLHSIAQSGPLFLMTELNIPNKPLALFATGLLLSANGHVRLDVIFSESGTHEASYKVHMSHPPEVEYCEDCHIQDLQHLIDSIQDADKKVSLATSANLIYNFFIKYYTLIICDPDSPLYSELYDANLQFPLDSSFSRATIASWPKYLTTLNFKIAQGEKLTRDDVNDFLNYVDSVLTSSVSVSHLQDQFNLDHNLATEISTLAETHQLKRNFEKCQQMPSIVTMVKRESKLENKEEIFKLFKSFLDFMEVKILCLEQDQLEMEIETWLMTVEEESGFAIYVIDDYIHLMLPPQVCYVDTSVHLVHPPEFTLVFPFEPETQDLIDIHGLTLFQGLYHRALSFSLISSLQVVLKSTMVLDAFILPYSPTYILAARSTVTSYFVGENQNGAVKKLKCAPKSLNFSPGDPLEKYENNHKQVSLMESIWRYDSKKCVSKSNVTPVFINISKQRRLKFIKAKSGDHSNHFKSGADFYEIYEDNYSKYLKKKISSGKICCYEFLAWFKKSGQVGDESDDSDDSDGENSDNVVNEGAHFMSLTNDDWLGYEVKLPLKMELTNGEIFVRRQKKKVVSFPDIRNDPEAAMYRDLVLFKHHTSREEFENLTSTEIINMHGERDILPEMGNGKQLSKIETVKKRCNKAMMEVKFDVSDEEYY